MRERNPGMYVFCEPLHNELFLAIYREQHLRQCGHDYSTTNEYINQGQGFFKLLRQAHPLISGGVFTFKVDQVIKYFEIFDSLDKHVILQPNRMHFIISDITKAFDCTVAHLIRHPLDVFNSIMFSSPKLKYLQESFGLNPYALRLLKCPNQYFLDEQCNFISQYFGVMADCTLYHKYLHPKRYYLERFLIVWTIVNWYAVGETDVVNGMVIRYEDCVAGDGLQKIANFAGINMETSKVKLHSKSIRKHSHKDLELCYMLAEKNGIMDKFKYLMARFSYVSECEQGEND